MVNLDPSLLQGLLMITCLVKMVMFFFLCSTNSQVVIPYGVPNQPTRKKILPFPQVPLFSPILKVTTGNNVYHWSDAAAYSSLDQTVHDKSNLDPMRHDSPAAGQSTSNSICHDAATHINSSAYSGSDGNATSAIAVENIHENFSHSGRHNYDELSGLDSHCVSQQEAALTKFRLKRKDRCFEKKVRYQSRKRLAEQRPRVKGKFVRQVHNDSAVAEAGGGS